MEQKLYTEEQFIRGIEKAVVVGYIHSDPNGPRKTALEIIKGFVPLPASPVGYTAEQVRREIVAAYDAGARSKDTTERFNYAVGAMKELASLPAPTQEVEKKGIDLESLQARFDALFNEPDAAEQFRAFVEKKRAQDPNQYDAMRVKMDAYFNHPDCAERLLAAASLVGYSREQRDQIVREAWDAAEWRYSYVVGKKSSDEVPPTLHQYLATLPPISAPKQAEPTGEWWCATCQTSPLPENVTFEERHDKCGCLVTVVPLAAPTVEPLTYREALIEARKWIVSVATGVFQTDQTPLPIIDRALSSSVSAPTSTKRFTLEEAKWLLFYGYPDSKSESLILTADNGRLDWIVPQMFELLRQHTGWDHNRAEKVFWDRIHAIANLSTSLSAPTGELIEALLEIDLTENVECEVDGEYKLMNEYRILVAPESAEDKTLRALASYNQSNENNESDL